MALLDPRLAEILVCPACRSSLDEDEAASELVCTGCGYRYAVDDGVPNMLIDEATKPA